MHSVILYSKSKAGKYFLIEKKKITSRALKHSIQSTSAVILPFLSDKKQVRLKVTEGSPPTSQQASAEAVGGASV